MAEVLGIVSSVITVVQVAGHIGPKMIALKRLWDEVRDIPETIEYQMKQLQLLSPVIDDMENEFLQSRNAIKNDSAARRSFEYCRQALAELESLIERLQLQISSAKKSKRVIAKFRVTLKQHLIEEHQRKLDYTLRLLEMSQQTYLMALTRLQPTMIASEFYAMQLKGIDEEFATNRNERDDELGLEEKKELSLWKQLYQRSGIRSPPNMLSWRSNTFFPRLSYAVIGATDGQPCHSQSDTYKVYQARLQLPWWLVTKAWDLQVHRAYGRWNVLLTTWNIRPNGSEIFDIVRDGKVRELQQAVATKKASLYDCDKYGWNLLHIAAFSNQMGVIKWLSQMGLDLTETNIATSTVSIVFANWSGLDDFLEFCRFALEQGAFDTGNKKLLPRLRQRIWADPRSVKAIAREIFPEPGLTLSTSDFQHIYWREVDIRGLRQAIKDEGISPATFRAQLAPYSDYRRSLQAFASAYVRSHIFSAPEEVNEWRLLARWMFTGLPLDEICTTKRAGPQRLPNSGYSLETPLFRGLCHSGRSGMPVSKTTQWWLEDLLVAGVDLQAYGERERDIFEMTYSNSKSWPCVWNGSPLYLVSFTYGPQLQDWSFVWDRFVEDYVGEFWQLVEPPPIHIPGAWVDEEDDE